MVYAKTTWKDRATEKSRTFTLQNNPDGTVTLIPVTGVVYEAGTPVNAVNMNKVEQGIANALPMDGSGSMAGHLSVLPPANVGRQVSTNNWSDMSANQNGHSLFSNNCYTDGAGEYRYSNTHASLGARGIRFSFLGVEYFDTGIGVPTTAGQAFTPVWQKMWHAGNQAAALAADGSVIFRGQTLDLGNLVGQKLYLYHGGEIKLGFGIDLFGGSRELSIFHSSPDHADGSIAFGHRSETSGLFTERMRLHKDGTLNRNGVDIPLTRDNGTNLEYFTGGQWRGVGGVKNVQRGTVSVSNGATSDVAINPVTMGKSIVNMPASISTSGGAVTAGAVYAVLVSPTIVRFTNTNPTFAYTVSYEVAEYY